MVIGWKSRTVDPSVASFRYRVLAPIQLLKARGHKVELFDEASIEQYDMVVFSKAYRAEDQALARRLRNRRRAVIMDICDNHFYNPFELAAYEQSRTDLLRMARLCTGFICSTPALARVLMAEAELKDRPTVVGDIVEDPGVMQGAAWPEGRPRLLWFGLHGSPNAPSGMTDLLNITPVLERAYGKTEFELVVVSNSREKFAQHIATLPFATRYVEWTAEAFAAELAAARAVLLPLSDNPFVACKTHNRLTLALAAGVAVIADPIESYREFAPYVWLADWEAGLKAVLSPDPTPVRARMRLAPNYMEAYWSPDSIGRQWEAALGLPIAAVTEGENDAAVPVGGLSLTVLGHLVGHLGADDGPEPPQVELMVNGAPLVSTTADLPILASTPAGGRRIRDRGGFIFSATSLDDADPSPLLRCTVRLASSGEPVRGAFLDLHAA